MNSDKFSNINSTPFIPPVFQHHFIPFNPSYVELPEAKAEDLTPRSGWVSKLNDIEKKYLEERNLNTDLREEIQHLHLQLSTLESTSELNLEQLSAHVLSLEREIEAGLNREEDLKGQVKARDDYIKTVKETIKENEDRYLQHLETVKKEYGKLEENNKFLKERIEELTQESHSLRLQAGEAKNEAARVQGMRDTEKTLLQNQLKETQTEMAKLNAKYFESTKELERVRVMLEETSKKNFENEREIINKEREYQRLNELRVSTETLTRGRNEESEKMSTAKLNTLTHKLTEEKSDLETKYQLEKKNAYELKVQLDQANKLLLQLRQENETLKVVNRANEEALLKAEFAEKENNARFSALKIKYDGHFSITEQEKYDKEIKLVRYREQLESLKLEKESQEKLIFQYQNFLKIHNLDYEFNNLARIDGRSMNKTPTEVRHEAREKAIREYYLEQEGKRMRSLLQDKDKNIDEENLKRLDNLKRQMSDMSDNMEEEWRKLFSNISEFKTRIYN